MNATILKQQKLNSLRKKDTMWIYKNPQGLLILEDVGSKDLVLRRITVLTCL